MNGCNVATSLKNHRQTFNDDGMVIIHHRHSNYDNDIASNFQANANFPCSLQQLVTQDPPSKGIDPTSQEDPSSSLATLFRNSPSTPPLPSISNMTARKGISDDSCDTIISQDNKKSVEGFDNNVSPSLRQLNYSGGVALVAAATAVIGPLDQIAKTTPPVTKALISVGLKEKKQKQRGERSGQNSSKKLKKDSCSLSSPTEDPYIIGPNDVIFGRGGLANKNPGNIQFRHIVSRYRASYLSAPKSEKPRYTEMIVNYIRHSLKPPGRFIRRDDARGGCWEDAGDKKAREKVSQALREGATDIRVFYEAASALLFGNGDVPKSNKRKSTIPNPLKKNELVDKNKS
mmetsp:Transcript_26791/g.53449  ORF Transcript_26791/g.53449 Transcript_26791/m.53449 type:complete len:345 (+) Transcript_26791:283-1317(+)